MNTENSGQVKVATKQPLEDIQANAEEHAQYKRILSHGDAEENAQAVDFRRVQHGHGPCACCGPYSE